ncbi:AfsR/SARP family transcriptional regulator [Actinomadura chibensis]|uniref:SARP family transcriptional regulator n=1 Tax=Actinomadura chibensis TaxID=392828 RepID=A0A5D0NU97_9ACTN|nr:BTAD domain-containing putative transcriptional regulator [Actinomadura chibensis]TYB47764.1 SARP family transcriptional regulator [Actinomadura chibensis]
MLVALEDGGVGRAAVQSRLWPDSPPREAGKRLRQALWRIGRETGGRVLDVSPAHIRLAPGVETDLRRGERFARRLSRGEADAGGRAETALLGRELLAGWTDEAVRPTRDRWDRLRLLALERLAERALLAGDVPGAMELAESAARVDQIGEAPHRILAAAHLARGDNASAWRVYARYRDLLVTEMGLEPSRWFLDLVEELVESRRVRGMARPSPAAS